MADPKEPTKESETKESSARREGAASSRIPRKVPELHADRMGLTEHKRNSWTVHIPHGTEPDDLETAAYWAHLSHKLRQHDVIECLWEDGTGEATCRVLGSGHGWVKVQVLHAVKYKAFRVEEYNTILPGHRVQYVNNFVKWSVIRDADKRVLKDKCDTEGEAYTWLASYAKSISN